MFQFCYANLGCTFMHVYAQRPHLVQHCHYCCPATSSLLLVVQPHGSSHMDSAFLYHVTSAAKPRSFTCHETSIHLTWHSQISLADATRLLPRVTVVPWSITWHQCAPPHPPILQKSQSNGVDAKHCMHSYNFELPMHACTSTIVRLHHGTQMPLGLVCIREATGWGTIHLKTLNAWLQPWSAYGPQLHNRAQPYKATQLPLKQ